MMRFTVLDLTLKLCVKMIAAGDFGNKSGCGFIVMMMGATGSRDR